MAEENTPLGTLLVQAVKSALEKKSKDGRVEINPEDLIEPTGVACKIPGCEGIIVRGFYIPYIPAQFGGENMLGPGSENVATIENKKLNSIYCPLCGIKYEFVPK
jgi:hypothetical protein